jgi:hypothetical protein
MLMLILILTMIFDSENLCIVRHSQPVHTL